MSQDPGSGGPRGGFLERFRVHPQPSARAQNELLALEFEVAEGGRGVRAQNTAGDVQGPPQIVRRRLGAQIRLQQVHRPLAVKRVPFGEGEQLDEVRSLPQPPGVLLDGPVAHRDAKTAEQPDPYALELFGRLSRRPLLFLRWCSMVPRHPHAYLDGSMQPTNHNYRTWVMHRVTTYPRETS
jgi:hypothetical protein